MLIDTHDFNPNVTYKHGDKLYMGLDAKWTSYVEGVEMIEVPNAIIHQPPNVGKPHLMILLPEKSLYDLLVFHYQET